jgi:Fe-S-cluster containining protein
MDFNGISKYKSMSSNALLLKLEELDEKLEIARACQTTENMIQTLLEYRTNIEEEIELRIATGQINEMTYFEVDDFLRKKNELKIAYEELEQDAKNRWISEELNDKELQEELNKIKNNYEREINELNKTFQ